MKTQLVITDADPTFLAALMETMAAMEKDQGDEVETFVARFPDFESPDLEWIRDKAAEVIKTRGAIPDEFMVDPKTLTQHVDNQRSYSFSESTSTETVLPEFRYFRNPTGDEWRVPTDGGKGEMRMRDQIEWEPSISKLPHFADEAGPIGHYEEFIPGNESFVMAPSDIIRDLLREGMELAGVLAGETADVTRADRWIYNAGQFLEAFGIPAATINIPEGWPRPGIPHVEETGNGTVVKTGAVIAPEPQPIEPETVFGHPIEAPDKPAEVDQESPPSVEGEHDQASS